MVLRGLLLGLVLLAGCDLPPDCKATLEAPLGSAQYGSHYQHRCTMWVGHPTVHVCQCGKQWE